MKHRKHFAIPRGYLVQAGKRADIGSALVQVSTSVAADRKVQLTVLLQDNVGLVDGVSAIMTIRQIAELRRLLAHALEAAANTTTSEEECTSDATSAG